MEENEERDIIVEKYKRGRDKLSAKEIDEWEDPQSEIYHVTDRYGFIHNYRLPEKLTDFENRIRQQENSRLQKWLKMLKSWEQYFPNSDKLKTRVYKGIPNAVRGEVWSRLLNIYRLKQEQDGKYEEMLSYGLDHSPDIRQIDLDVNRTYRNHIMFRERYNTKQQMLFKVLVAYSVYNSEIGYCQGMSQIAALLLMYMDEEDAFWSLSVLMSDEKHAMHGFFIPGFPKLIRFARHHDDIIKKFLPKLSKLFKKYDIDSTLYTLKWFFQCFLDRVPFSLTLRLWDCFLLDGEIILTGMSYTLLKLHKRTLLRKGMESMIEFLQIELEKDFGYHDDQAITALQQSVQELRKHSMLSPKEGPKPTELPSRPFGLILGPDRRSLMNDDQSIVGSIILRPNDSVSLAATSRTGSEMGSVRSVSESEHTLEENKTLERSISLYDNVDIHESIEAAKRLSSLDVTNRPNSRESKQHSRTQTPEFNPQITDENKQNSEINETFKNSIESKTINENNSIKMISIETETKEQVIEESILINSKSSPENRSNGSPDFGNSSHLIRTNNGSDLELRSESILNRSLESDSLFKTDINNKNHNYFNNQLRNEFFRTSSVKTVETFSKTSGTSSVSENSSSVLFSETLNESHEVLEENDETVIHFENNTETNGEIGSRTSPMRTVYKRSAEKRQMTTSVVSPTSPVRASLIPRYVANTPLNQNSIKARNESNNSNNSSQIKNSFVKNKSTTEETKLRIFVPYSHSDRNNDNKIQLRVDSPTLQLKKIDSKTLPTVDT